VSTAIVTPASCICPIRDCSIEHVFSCFGPKGGWVYNYKETNLCIFVVRGVPGFKTRQFFCRHQLTYKVAAISASLGVTSLAVLAVHYRFAWNLNNGGEFPFLEAALTMLLTFGGVVSTFW